MSIPSTVPEKAGRDGEALEPLVGSRRDRLWQAVPGLPFAASRGTMGEFVRRFVVGVKCGAVLGDFEPYRPATNPPSAGM